MAKKRIKPNYKPLQNDGWVAWKKGKDNKDYYNSNGVPHNCRFCKTIRIPSLNESNKVWNNFYKLFPEIKTYLMGGEQPYLGTYRNIEFDEKKNIFIVRKEIHFGNLFKPKTCRTIVRTYKYKKTW